MLFKSILALGLVQLFPMCPADGAIGSPLLITVAPGCPGAPLLLVCPLLEFLKYGNLTRTQATGS